MAINFSNGGSQDMPARVLATHRFEWNTRTSVSTTSGTATRWIYESSFSKISDSSMVTVQAIFPAWSNSAGAVQGVVYVGNQTEESGSGYSYTGDGYLKVWLVNTAIANNTQTGTVNFGIGYRANNGGSEKPFSSVWNPTSSDDNRLDQSGAIVIVQEIDQ